MVDFGLDAAVCDGVTRVDAARRRSGTAAVTRQHRSVTRQARGAPGGPGLVPAARREKQEPGRGRVSQGRHCAGPSGLPPEGPEGAAKENRR